MIWVQYFVLCIETLLISQYLKTEYQDPYSKNGGLMADPKQESAVQRFFGGRYPIEQRIENKKRGIGRQRYPFVGMHQLLKPLRHESNSNANSLDFEFNHGRRMHLRACQKFSRTRNSSLFQGLSLRIISIYFLFQQ